MREAQSLQSLMILISRCIEVLNLWKIACDHQFEVVTKDLTGPQKATLKDSTLRQLLKPDNEEVSCLNYILNRILHFLLAKELLYSFSRCILQLIKWTLLPNMPLDVTILLWQPIFLVLFNLVFLIQNVVGYNRCMRE